MPVTLPVVYRRMAYSAHSGDGTITLITLDHADFDDPLRFVADQVAVTSNGDTYQPSNFKFIPPEPVAGTSYTPAQLSLPVVDQQLTLLLRSVITEIDVEVQEVMISDPDVVVETFAFKMSGDHPFDAKSVLAPLIFEQVLEEAMPPKVMSPALAPGLFGG